MKTIPTLYQWLSYLMPVHLERRVTPFNRRLDVDLYSGKIMLNTQRANYSFGRLHTVMEQALKELCSKGCRFERVLMLGYGGGSAASIIHTKYNSSADITAVEIDPVVIELAKKWFYSDQVRFENADAFDFVQRTTEKYDLVICDLFFDIYMPDQSKTTEFYRRTRNLLREGGTFLQNLMLKPADLNEAYQGFSEVYPQSEKRMIVGTNAIFTGLV